MTRSCRVIRVFTRDGVGGNHLGVVEDLSDLDTATMQAIAAHLGFSETVFIDRAGAVPLVRIFTPEMEMLFAGHPLVGSAWVMFDNDTDVNRLRCGIGEVLIRRDGDVVWVDAPMVPANARVDTSSFSQQVGLPGAIRTWRVDMPLDYRMLELATVEAVSQVRADTTAFGEAHGLTVFAREDDRVRMRFFIPEAGIDEDPATGSAAVALATMLAADGEERGSLVIHQGEEIGHPSRIHLRWGEATASIGGTVAIEPSRELAM